MTKPKGTLSLSGESCSLLADEDRLTEADAHLRIPPEVRAVIGERVGRLSERCRSLLVPAAVIGREFGLGALAARQRASACRSAGRAA